MRLVSTLASDSLPEAKFHSQNKIYTPKKYVFPFLKFKKSGVHLQ